MRRDATMTYILPYNDKRKQLLKMKFLVNEQNVSVMYIDINAISGCFDLNIFQQDECFCSKLKIQVDYAKSNLNTSLSQILMICQLLPFVRVGQYRIMTLIYSEDNASNQNNLYMYFTFNVNKTNRD